MCYLNIKFQCCFINIIKYDLPNFSNESMEIMKRQHLHLPHVFLCNRNCPNKENGTHNLNGCTTLHEKVSTEQAFSAYHWINMKGPCKKQCTISTQVQTLERSMQRAVPRLKARQICNSILREVHKRVQTMQKTQPIFVFEKIEPKNLTLVKMLNDHNAVLILFVINCYCCSINNYIFQAQKW